MATKESWCPKCSKITTQTLVKGSVHKGKCHNCGSIVG